MISGAEREFKNQQKAERLIREITAMAKDKLEVLLGSGAVSSFRDLGVELLLQERLSIILEQANQSDEWMVAVSRRGFGATCWGEEGVVVMRLRKQGASVLEVLTPRGETLLALFLVENKGAEHLSAKEIAKKTEILGLPLENGIFRTIGSSPPLRESVGKALYVPLNLDRAGRDLVFWYPRNQDFLVYHFLRRWKNHEILGMKTNIDPKLVIHAIEQQGLDHWGHL